MRTWAFQQLTSTNSAAWQLLLAREAQHLDWITARHQTQGRGQRGKTWLQAAGQGLAASLALTDLSWPPEQAFDLNRCAALAVVDVVQSMGGPKLHIKWPNDVLAQHQKLAGILVETSLTGGQLKDAVVGFGLNRQPVQALMTLTRPAVSLQELGLTVPEAELLARLQEGWQYRWQQTQSAPHTVAADYLEHLYAYAEAIEVHMAGSWVQAQLIGVTQAGQLRCAVSGHPVLVAQPNVVRWPLTY